MKKLLILTLTLIFLAGGLWFFANKRQKSASEIESGGIISLLPVATEILFAIDAENVNGVSSFCNYPEETKNLPKYGDAFSINIEQIVVRKPDLVLVGQNAINPSYNRLSNYGINVVYLENANNIEDIYNNILLIGNLVEKQKNAGKVISQIKKQVEIAKQNVPTDKPKIFVELSDGLWTIGNKSYINEIIEISGGTNIFGDQNQEYFKTNWETIYNRNPDIIISLGKTDYNKYPLANEISAMQNGKVVKGFDADILVRPGPRIKDAIKNLNEIINEE